VTGRRGRSKQLQDGLKKKRTLEIGRGSTTSHCAHNSLWIMLSTYRKTDNSRRRPSSSCATIRSLVANCPAKIFGPNIFSSVPLRFFYIWRISHLALMCMRAQFNISQISLNSMLCIGMVMCFCRISTDLHVTS